MARKRGVQRGHLHRQGDAWYLAYREDALDENGKLIRVRRNPRIASVKEVSKREVERLAREILDKVNTQVLEPSSLMTVAEFVESRFNPEVVWSLKAAGKKHYKYILNKHVLPAIGRKRLRDIKHDDVQRLVRMKVEAGLSDQTAVHIRNAVSAVFNHAKLKDAYSGDNPAEGIRFREIRRREAHALGFEQSSALLDALESPAREMVLLSITTSLNVAEMLGLRRKWVNLSGEPKVVGTEVLPEFALAVRENCYRGTFGTVKRKARRRFVPLSAYVRNVLTEVLSKSEFTGPDDLVFGSSKGTPLDDKNIMKRQIKPVAQKLGMAWVSWHVFRHTQCGVNPSVETNGSWHTCRLAVFPTQSASSPSQWSSVGEAEAGSAGEQPAEE